MLTPIKHNTRYVFWEIVFMETSLPYNYMFNATNV
jgi:hypothetical protein